MFIDEKSFDFMLRRGRLRKSIAMKIDKARLCQIIVRSNQKAMLDSVFSCIR